MPFVPSGNTGTQSLHPNYVAWLNAYLNALTNGLPLPPDYTGPTMNPAAKPPTPMAPGPTPLLPSTKPVSPPTPAPSPSVAAAQAMPPTVVLPQQAGVPPGGQLNPNAVGGVQMPTPKPPATPATSKPVPTYHSGIVKPLKPTVGSAHIPVNPPSLIPPGGVRPLFPKGPLGPSAAIPHFGGANTGAKPPSLVQPSGPRPPAGPVVIAAISGGAQQALIELEITADSLEAHSIAVNGMGFPSVEAALQHAQQLGFYSPNTAQIAGAYNASSLTAYQLQALQQLQQHYAAQGMNGNVWAQLYPVGPDGITLLHPPMPRLFGRATSGGGAFTSGSGVAPPPPPPPPPP